MDIAVGHDADLEQDDLDALGAVGVQELDDAPQLIRDLVDGDAQTKTSLGERLDQRRGDRLTPPSVAERRDASRAQGLSRGASQGGGK